MSRIESVEELEAIYGFPAETSTVKVATALTPQYRELIEASPFAALATCGPESLDCSPRGDAQRVVYIDDDKTLHLPDRRGNNRIDSLRNLVRDPRVALLFLLPGCGTTIRVNGNAEVTADADLLGRYAVKSKAPRTVIVITIDEVYFQCARAVVRSELWNPDRFLDPAELPTPGQILDCQSDHQIDGREYDRQWPDRAQKSLW